MNADDFAARWGELAGERLSLISRRTDLETELIEVRNKLLHLEEALNHLAPLANLTSEIAGLGITDAIRLVLQSSDDKLSAQDIRQQLSDGGFDLGQLTAPMASIYKVLSRLEESKEVEKEKEGTKVFYRWKTTSPMSDEDIEF
jgi:hypothetical protein